MIQIVATLLLVLTAFLLGAGVEANFAGAECSKPMPWEFAIFCSMVFGGAVVALVASALCNQGDE